MRLCETGFALLITRRSGANPAPATNVVAAQQPSGFAKARGAKGIFASEALSHWEGVFCIGP